MGRPITVQVGPLAATTANNIALSQTPSGTTPLTLNGSLVSGGVAILDTPRRVRVTTNADEHTKTLTFVGTTFSGALASETLTMPSSATTVDTALDYKTIVSITPSASFAAAITVGASPVAASPWARSDEWAASPVMSLAVTVSGTANYTVQETTDDPNSPTDPVTPANVAWYPSADSAVVAATASAQSTFAAPITFARVVLNSATNPGFVKATFVQQGGATV